MCARYTACHFLKMSLNNTISKEIGAKGEKIAAKYLRDNGYIILKRNWRDRYGEVDIIAEGKDNIVFVEVKTRSENALVSGAEAIDEKKMRLIRNEAVMFTKRLNTDLEPRIDVAEVTLIKSKDGKDEWKIKYIKDAF